MIETIRPHAAWPAGVRLLTVARRGGVSSPPYAWLNLAHHVGDDPSAIAQNRRRAQESLSMPAAPVYLDQRHTTRVLYVTAETARAGAGEAPRVADACWTDRAGVVLAVMTADCLPVALASRDGRVLALIHAGWRGLLDGIVRRTLEALPVEGKDLQAWIGPAISQRHFEVGPDFPTRFVAKGRALPEHFQPCRDRSGDDKARMDLKAVAAWQLAQCGVEQVEVCSLCTWEDADRFYSYRREGRTGRMATYLWREPE